METKNYWFKKPIGKKPIFAYAYYADLHISDEDFDRIDVLNYSFAHIVNNELNVEHLTEMADHISRAHHKGVTFVLSVGGWGASGFSNMAEYAESRSIFIQSVITAINKYNLDGIDLDWEYPTTGSGSDMKNPRDKSNFTFLLRELRAAMDKVRPDLLLTSAFAAGAYAANNYYELGNINEYLNFIHIMTYDLIDYRTFITSHHTNLYTSGYSANAGASVDAAVRAYINAGADKSKIVIGAAFYGHIGTVDTEKATDGMLLPSQNLSNAVNYKQINTHYLNNPDFTYRFDDVAKAPWLFDGTTFITYDDETSIKHKCLYIHNQDLAGIMFWQLGGDHESTLLKAVFDGINK